MLQAAPGSGPRLTTSQDVWVLLSSTEFSPRRPGRRDACGVILGSRLLHTDRPAKLQSGSPPNVGASHAMGRSFRPKEDLAAASPRKMILVIPTALALRTHLSGGKVASSTVRSGSSHFGNISFEPRVSGDSSTAKPGGSVAISKRTPPGSR
jgi:hypothetical protein